MIGRKLAFPSGAQKSVLSGFGHASRRWRFNLEKRNSLDRDARDFIEKAGIKNGQGRQQISDYVRGLKAMGLWGQVVSFPLRFQQNAPAGNTLYFLGKDVFENTLTGTIQGSLTRGSNGMIFTAGANTILTNDQPITETEFWLGGCVQNTTAGSALGIFLLSQTGIDLRASVGTTGNISLQIYEVDAGGPASDLIALQNFSTAFGFFQFRGDAEFFLGQKNLEVPIEETFLEPDVSDRASMTIGNINATIPFLFFANGILGDSETRALLYSLYKSTLGQGLGLP